MSSIVELIGTLEQKLKLLRNLEEAKRKAERYRRRIDDLGKLKTACTATIESSAALQAASVPFSIPPSRDLQNFVARFGTLAGQAACQKICSEDFPSEVPKIEASIAQAEAALKGAWQKLATPPLEGDKVAKIGTIFGDSRTRSNFSQIAADCRQISASALKLPKQTKEVRKIKDLKSKVELDIEDMKSKGIDKDVLAFLLENVTPGKKTSLKAAFAKPSVRNWLLADDHADHFQLTVSI